MINLGIISVFAILYSFLDAWHDEKVIKKQNKGLFNWHQIDAGIKLMVACVVAYLAFGFTWVALLVAVGILAVRWLTFDFILNRLMGWGNNKKGGIDSVTWYLRLVFLGAVIAAIFLLSSCSTTKIPANCSTRNNTNFIVK